MDLDGEWALVSAVINGAPLPDQLVSACRRVTRERETTVFMGGKVVEKARFKLDESRAPAHIDLLVLDGRDFGKSRQGIVERTQTELRINLASPGKDRPTDFNTSHGDGCSLTTWRLLK